MDLAELRELLAFVQRLKKISISTRTRVEIAPDDCCICCENFKLSIRGGNECFFPGLTITYTRGSSKNIEVVDVFFTTVRTLRAQPPEKIRNEVLTLLRRRCQGKH